MSRTVQMNFGGNCPTPPCYLQPAGIRGKEIRLPWTSALKTLDVVVTKVDNMFDYHFDLEVNGSTIEVVRLGLSQLQNTATTIAGVILQAGDKVAVRMRGPQGPNQEPFNLPADFDVMVTANLEHVELPKPRAELGIEVEVATDGWNDDPLELG